MAHARRNARIALGLAAAPLIVGLIFYLRGAVAAIRFPFELDYGEGIVWQQLRLIVSGHSYGAIDGLPAIVFHYPPLFHALAAALAGATGLDQLAAGRLLSVASTLATAGFVGLIAARLARRDAGGSAPAICGLFAALIVISLWPVVNWSILMRVDMVALAFTFAGVWLGILALTMPRAVYLAALCFVAAVYTRQTAIAAPAAVFGVLLFIAPRTAWTGIATCVVAGLAVLGALSWATDGGFLRHILLYNINRLEPSRLIRVLMIGGLHAGYLAAMAIGLRHHLQRRMPAYQRITSAADLRQRLRAAPDDAGLAMILAYLVLATLMLALVAKSGSSVNYFLEWITLVALLAGLALRDAAVTAFGRDMASSQPTVMLTIILPLVIAVQAILLPDVSDRLDHISPARTVELRALTRLVRDAPLPVISDDMVIVQRGGKTVQWEPAIFAELASNGVWNERPFVRHIQARDFAFFITVGDRNDPLFDSRYSPAVADAMAVQYPVKRSLAGYVLHYPR